MDQNLNQPNPDVETSESQPSGSESSGARTAPAKRAARRSAAPQGPPPVSKRAAATKQAKPSKSAAAQKVTAKRAAAAEKAPAAEKAAPAKKAAPTKKAPAAKKPAAKKAAPAQEPAPVEIPAPVEEVVPETAIAPVEKAVPVESPVPVENPVPASEEAGPASEAEVRRAWKDNRLAQVLYHDWEAGSYDEKWSISFDDRCISYARDRFSALVGPEVLRTEQWPYRTSLEIGAGTGFFSLNLRQAGVLDQVQVSDVSAAMVEAAKRNASALGFEVQGAVAGAEALPFENDSFDLVVGHAVIHHIPDVEAALREVLRVLRPGGRFVIAGEPTRAGDWYARRLGRATWRVTTTVTQWPRFREKWARSQDELDASSRAAALEAVVDLHTFVPDELRAMAQRAGAQQVQTQTEELLAAFLGWPVRTFEAAVNPDALGWRWANFAYRSWRRLSAFDRVLARGLPESIFYNVGVTGIKPRQSVRLSDRVIPPAG